MTTLPPHMRALLNCRNCRIFITNVEERAIYLVGDDHANGAADDDAPAVQGACGHGPLRRVPWGTGIVGQVAQTGEFVAAARPREHPAFDAAVDRGTNGEEDSTQMGSPIPAPLVTGSVLAASGAEVIHPPPQINRTGGLLGAAVHDGNGAVAGVIVVLDKLQGPFNAADEATLRHIAALVSKELARNGQLHALRRAQAQSDNLLLGTFV